MLECGKPPAIISSAPYQKQINDLNNYLFRFVSEVEYQLQTQKQQIEELSQQIDKLQKGEA